jgi:hypothetical protein
MKNSNNKIISHLKNVCSGLGITAILIDIITYGRVYIFIFYVGRTDDGLYAKLKHVAD